MDAAALLSATRAYSTAPKTTVETGNAASPVNFGGFADILQQTITNTVAQTKQAEVSGQQAAVGKGDLVDVVTAIASAEVQLETMITMRNQVIQAYQEVMRMPI